MYSFEFLVCLIQLHLLKSYCAWPAFKKYLNIFNLITLFFMAFRLSKKGVAADLFEEEYIIAI